jgi:DNA-binding GntR family transcriptional regulator
MVSELTSTLDTSLDGPDRLPPSFPEHVRRLLEQEIVQGRLAPGERVSEEALAERIGVSRTPVREAMRVLEGQGLIVRRRGRGTFVAATTSADEAKTLYDLRIPLESHLTERAARRISVDELETLVHMQRRFAEFESGDKLQLSRLVAVDSALHWTIYRAAQSDLISIVSSYWGRLLRELYTRVYTSRPTLDFSRDHDRIVAAIADRDPERACAAMADHIRNGWEALRLSFEAESPVSGSSDA